MEPIFDPTDGSQGQGPERFWKLKPFAENTSLAQIQDELDNLTMTAYAQEVLQLTTGDFEAPAATLLKAQIGWWRNNPFQPHLLARMRPVTYQKAVVMRYIDNLVAWADSLFTRDTIESINEATQLYIYALNILGPKPVIIPDPDPVEPQSYDQLDQTSAFDAFSNALVGTEVLAPPPPEAGIRCGGEEPPPNILWGSPYFCVPPNEKLLGYWDTIADRLFKIRHCMNIEGVTRTLPLFEPPIDPALLVRAAAAGLDLSSVLNDINAAAPPYRYSVLYAKAVELANAVASLGSTALSVLEKADAEELASLRQRHEVATQQAVLEVRLTQFREAEESLKAAERSLLLAREREQYYSSREEVSHAEAAGLSLRAVGQATSFVAQALHSAAGGAAYVPNFYIGVAGMSTPVQWQEFGGSNVNAAMSAAAKAVEATGAALNISGDIVGTMAGYRRRKDDWDHQARLATLEIRQIERQIEAARVRVEVARHEVAVTRQQIAQAKEVERFLVRKFTNAQLYGWMKSQLAAVYYQAYKLAFEMARRAERAFQHERGDPAQSFVSFGYWDSMKKGLLAGERLLHDLRRMDAAYIAQNKRELELVKMVSLAEHDPDQLVALRRSGIAALSLTESDFDRDFSTHYLRRLKAVAVTVACTTGPYQGVHGTLTLQKGATRRTSDSADLDTSFGAIQSICTSQAQSDAGTFELQFKDERLLPFEGVGAHTDGGSGPQWQFELSKGNRFSFETIDDLVLELRYTARAGRDQAVAPAPTAHTLKRLVRVRAELADAWQAFKDGETAALQLPLPASSWTRARNEDPPAITEVSVYGWWSASPPTGDLEITPPGAAAIALDNLNDSAPEHWSGAVSHTVDDGEEVWTLAPGNEATLEDLWIGFTYDVTVTP